MESTGTAPEVELGTPPRGGIGGLLFLVGLLGEADWLSLEAGAACVVPVPYRPLGTPLELPLDTPVEVGTLPVPAAEEERGAVLEAKVDAGEVGEEDE